MLKGSTKETINNFNNMKTKIIFCIALMTGFVTAYGQGQLKPDVLNYKPFIWRTGPPPDCPYGAVKKYNRHKV